MVEKKRRIREKPIVPMTEAQKDLYCANVGLIHKQFNKMANRLEFYDPDCLQFVKLTVCRMIPEWDPARSGLATYITWATFWGMGDWRRRKGSWERKHFRNHRFDSSPEGDDYETTIPTVPNDELDFLEHDLLRKELKRLNQRDQAVLHKMYWEGKTLSEIGEEMGVTKERVRQLAHRAKEKLKKHMGENYER
jgi:RNA polymerase sigma factor (sigma-70 family)